MRGKLLIVAIAVMLLGGIACTAEPAGPETGSGPEPALHPPGGRIGFTRKCADEESHRVGAYARMESTDGRVRAVAAVFVGYPAEGGDALRVEVWLQRLRIDGGESWRNVSWTIRLLAGSDSLEREGPEMDGFLSHERGPQEFRTGDNGTVDWITFVEPGEEVDGAEPFYHEGPDLGFALADLGVDGPNDEFRLGLEIRNRNNGETIRLPAPLVRVPERVWAMESPDPRPLGLLGTLDPREEGGLPRFLGRAWKYRKCIEERRAAKRFLGPYAQDTGVGSAR
ncbi:MAG: hypothetical protein OXN16_15030 [Gammaproteobacteria bacterium]|nr:hypothetical protein [Gammaproteobacteria bacterium]MDE0282363.1 hypothetical protein [Gammaproteobacteria bacterium]